MSGRLTCLSAVVDLDVDAVPVDRSTSYEIVGVLNRGRGLLYRDPILGAETSYKTLNRIGPGQIVYSRLKAFEGAITVAPRDFEDGLRIAGVPNVHVRRAPPPGVLRTHHDYQATVGPVAGALNRHGRATRARQAGDFLTIEISLPARRRAAPHPR